MLNSSAKKNKSTSSRLGGSLFRAIALKLFAIIALLAVLAIVVAVVGPKIQKGIADSTIGIEINDDIDNTPSVIREMRAIGQWEFLTISDEQLVDTISKGLFSDSQLVRIYYGTLRLGIDFSHTSGQWVRMTSDTVYVTLPPPQLLDQRFIDEARTTSFMETGKWTSADRQSLYNKAHAEMISRCMTQENIDIAAANSRRSIEAFLTPLVAPKGVVVTTDTASIQNKK